MRNLVVWLSFAWSFGIFVFGHLWRFHSVICDLQIIVCCLKPPIMSQILRKQCVNILFQLGVFYNIQRKSHFYKTLIFRTLSEQRNIMEYHFAILIIWRSQVQALAGPRWKSRSYIKNVAPFSLFCEQFANKIAFREHQYNLSAIIDSLILFANLIIFVRKPFFGILFSNISNTSKHLFYQGFFLMELLITLSL